MNHIPAPKAVFFDWDGTLVDSYDLVLAAHNYARQNLDLKPLAQEDFRPYFGQPRAFIYGTLYGEETGAQARAFFEEFITKHHIEHLSPIKRMADILSLLHAQSIPMAVISNKKGALLRQEVKTLDWGAYFPAVIGSGDTPEDKPSPQPIIMAAQSLGPSVAMEDIWYIGDTAVDLECANRAGCTSILVQEKPLETEHPPTTTVRNSAALHDFLLQCLKKQLKRSL